MAIIKNTPCGVFSIKTGCARCAVLELIYYMDLIAIGHEIQLFKDKLGLPNLH